MNNKPPFCWWFVQLWPHPNLILVGLADNTNIFQPPSMWRMLPNPTADEKWGIYTSLYIALYISWRQKNVQDRLFKNILSKSFHIWRRRPLRLCPYPYNFSVVFRTKVRSIWSACWDKWGLKVLLGIEKIIIPISLLQFFFESETIWTIYHILTFMSFSSVTSLVTKCKFVQVIQKSSVWNLSS